MGLQNHKLTAIPSRRFLAVTGVVTAMLLGCAEPQLDDLRRFVATTKASSPQVELDPPPQIEDYVPFTYTAQGLKDPFVPSAFAQQPEETLTPEEVETLEAISGVRPDPNRPREELEKFSLGSLQMVGSFFQEGSLWALVKAPDGIVHRVREGNYLGTNHGRITNISEQRIELVEIVREGPRWIERDAFLTLAEL